MFYDINTNRLLLKCISREDRQFIFEQFSDEQVTRYLFDEEPFTDISEADGLIDFYTQKEPRAQHRWVVILKENGQKIGTCGFHCLNRRDGTVEMGYDLKSDYRSQGYMTEAVARIIEFAKAQMNVKSIKAHIYPENIGSVALVKRLGFVLLDERVTYTFRNKEYEHHVYELTIKKESKMEDYIKSNKAAWEEAFDMRKPSWGSDIVQRVNSEDYPFFNEDTVRTLKNYDLKNKVIGQFCCNNGRELLSLVKSAGAKQGIGFDIAENMVSFANEKAGELNLPCEFVAANVLEIDDSYKARFDAVIITIGALCWLKNLDDYFAIVSKCMKKNAVIVINEQHPVTNMLAFESDDCYNKAYPLNCAFSYFSHEWIGNDGMNYITGKEYESKTFTDYTHPMSEIIGAMCKNGIVITNMQEFEYDISDGLEHLNNCGFPLSMIIEGRKD